MRVWAIVVAAGHGSRFGGPKQFEELGGRPLVDWAVEAARSVSEGVVLVMPQELVHQATAWRADEVRVVAGGDSRAASVAAGLGQVPDVAGVIVVHDGARPLAARALFEAVILAVKAGADAAVPGLAPTDTVKEVLDNRVVRTLDRSRLVAVQTPQAFRAEVLRKAHADSLDASDDACLVELAGGRVEVVPGDPRNLKVTDRVDLTLVKALIAR